MDMDEARAWLPMAEEALAYVLVRSTPVEMVSFDVEVPKVAMLAAAPGTLRATGAIKARVRMLLPMPKLLPSNLAIDLEAL